MSTISKNNFGVGDWVTFPFGVGDVVAQIVEDRGELGLNGRRLYRVRIPASDQIEPDSFEMPEDELRHAPSLDRQAIVAYLKSGALVDILGHNLGGKQQPQAWLTYSPRGGVVHTFVEELGLLGGAIVPFWALHQGKIFSPKIEDVLAYIETFGLNRTEARDIVDSIGATP